MYDFSNSLITTFPSINDKPSEPSALRAGNGAHLIAKHNQFVNQVNNALNNNQIEISSGSVGYFDVGEASTKHASGYLASESVIKLIFPAHTILFVSEWGYGFESPEDNFNVRLYLNGHFAYNKLAYNWWGQSPPDFAVSWYYGYKFADNENLEEATINALNYSIYSDGAIRELHFYNRLSAPVNFIARLTYASEITGMG